ncbi:MAG: hypothetical protein KME60_06370 [Cyanomargarita calcarea GSE-NOS-MK-12-04C]|jgi:hypothetical protein|uniref:DUF104 domain-containing protein n=1 Tax=Cyanomargarita calcarea GSE-NOS-MK-12-04C TaxID=2839659 RepID=A0A951QKI5_9CYAN|nr:hypothetical protein [Cyanomargarita calcarea GSE-NOS-MK-12-04C]
MEKISAIFDGRVFRPDQAIPLAPNTRVRLTIETLPSDGEEPVSFLLTARSLNLQGPSDWSANIDKYLSGLETEG